MHPRHQPTQHTAVRSTQHSGHTTGQCKYQRSAATPSAPLFLCAILSFYSNVTFAIMGGGGAAERPYEQKQPQYVRPVSLKQLNRPRRKGNGVDITPHTVRLSARRLPVRASAIQEAKCLTPQFSKYKCRRSTLEYLLNLDTHIKNASLKCIPVYPSDHLPRLKSQSQSQISGINSQIPSIEYQILKNGISNTTYQI